MKPIRYEMKTAPCKRDLIEHIQSKGHFPASGIFLGGRNYFAYKRERRFVIE